MAQVREGDEQGKDKKEALSREFILELIEDRWPKQGDDDCKFMQASQRKDINEIKAVDLTMDGKELGVAQSSFTPRYPALRNMSRDRCLECSKTDPGRCRHGTEIHSQLNKFIKKWRGPGEKIDGKLDNEEQLKEFVENIERLSEFTILASEVRTYGYANQKQLGKPYCWRSTIDAIGVKKDGTIIVVDWRVCCAFEPYEFWDSASEFSIKLHQTLIYREIIIARWKDFAKRKKDVPCPIVGILIVPMASTISVRGSAPRDCLDFTLLRENGFFDRIKEFIWTAQKPSKDGDGHSLRRGKETDEEEEDFSRKCKMPEGDCGKKTKLILEVGIPPDVKEIKEVRKPIAVKQEEPIRQMPDRQHFSGWTPTDSYRTAEKSAIIEQEPIVKPEGEDYSRKHKTPDGDCSNKVKLILEPPLPRYVEAVKEVRKPIAVKQEEPIKQLPDWQHLFGRTPTDSYRTAEMCDTRNAAVGHVTQMPDLQHYTARTCVHRYYTPEEALQLHSPYMQPGISAAQMAYGESAESKAYHFMSQEKAGCSCHGRKKCGHAQGAGQCDCKAAGKKCGYNCNCDEQICTNRGIMNMRYEEEDYSRNYTAFEDYCGYGRYMAGCSCHGRKKCAHARGPGQCDCKAAGKKCGYNCNCDEWICTNRGW